MKYKNQFVMKDSKKLAQPFFKWVGGKWQIADIILDEFPSEIENYYEPFVGAGAILFRVLQEYPNLKHVRINDSNIDGIIFYDLGVFNIIKKMNVNKELILSMEHLNASINSHLFYKKRGITGSIVTNDITYNEVLDIKSNTNMNIFYTVYGYLPIFYSRRCLITNYF